jgi:GTPase SAR1 family protein
VTNRESYDHLPSWIEEARTLAAKDVVIMLVGNKVDLADAQEGARQVPFLESSQLAQDQHTMLLESSARTGASVEEIFLTVSKSILNKRLDAAAEEERANRPDVVKMKSEWRGSPCDGVKC